MTLCLVQFAILFCKILSLSLSPSASSMHHHQHEVILVCDQQILPLSMIIWYTSSSAVSLCWNLSEDRVSMCTTRRPCYTGCVLSHELPATCWFITARCLLCIVLYTDSSPVGNCQCSNGWMIFYWLQVRRLSDGLGSFSRDIEKVPC